MVFRAGDDPRLVIGRQPHRLRLVELGILERGQPQQPIAQSRRQALLGDVDLVAKHQFHAFRQRPGNRRLLSAARWRQRSTARHLPRPARPCRTPTIRPRRSASRTIASTASRPILQTRRKKGPLIGMGLPLLVEEDAVARVPAAAFAAAGRSDCRNPPWGSVSWLGKNRS